MNRKNEIVVGAFVLLAAGLIVVGTIFLSGMHVTGGQQQLRARFETVGQLQPGNHVKVRGVQVGTVQDVSFGEGGGVVVTMRVRSDVPLPAHPLVVLEPSSLFGSWEAAIVPRSQRPDVQVDTTGLPEGMIPGFTTSDFAQLSDYAGDIARNLRQITERLDVAFNDTTSRNLAQVIGNFEQASEELAQLLGRQRQSFGAFADDMASAGEEVRSAVADLDSTLSRLEAATSGGELADIFQNTRDAAVSVNRLASQLDRQSDQLSATLAHADSTLRATQRIMERIDRGEGTLGQLSADTVLYENLAGSLAELRALLDDLKRHPQKYFNVSVF